MDSLKEGNNSAKELSSCDSTLNGLPSPMSMDFSYTTESSRVSGDLDIAGMTFVSGHDISSLTPNGESAVVVATSATIGALKANPSAPIKLISAAAIVSLATIRKAQSSLLLRTPKEIRQNIWILIVAHDKAIVPIQRRSKSNKFLWSKQQRTRNSQTYNLTVNVNAVPQLDAVSLSRVCYQLYEEVSLTNLFYVHNNFDFSAEPDHVFGNPSARLLNYSVAITESRRQAIRVLKYKWTRDDVWYAGEHMFSMLALLTGLKELHLVVDSDLLSDLSLHDLNFMKIRGYRELMDAVKGLENLTIEFIPPSIKLATDFLPAAQQIFKAALEHERTQPRVAINNAKIQKAMVLANLDIHGEGRLNEDKKPSFVSSRTRQKMQAVKSINNDGVMPARPTPKYDLQGTLVWVVEKVNDSRQFVTEIGEVGVQLHIVVQKHGGHRALDNYPAKEEYWEDFTKINPNEAALEIADLWDEKPAAFGKEIILNAWMELEYEGDVQYKLRWGISRLNAIVKSEAVKNGEKPVSMVAEFQKSKPKKKAKKRDD